MSVSDSSSVSTRRQSVAFFFRNLSFNKLAFWRQWGKIPQNRNDKRIVTPNHTVSDEILHSSANPNSNYSDNVIQTSKYTLLSFLPKNLFEQFHRFANLYFLFIIILNWVPQINAFGKEISMIPILFVLSVTAIKDLFEDRRRHKSDNRINNYSCLLYKKDESRYVKSNWKEISVGDMVRVQCNHVVPADILLLSSSDDQGLCFLETSNLDGESNLKQRQVPRGYISEHKAFHPTNFQSKIECDAPNNKIYRFHGSIIHSNDEKIPLSKENLLLRDCILKNTDYVVGIVVYAGHETKTMLNNGGPRYKRSDLEKLMNWDVIWCVVILVILCSIGAAGSSLWLSHFDNTTIVPYIPSGVASSFNPPLEGFLTFWTFVIILQIMIPLSLYVSIEIVKLGQVYLIHEDAELYDPITNKRIECRALNIPEELGQIQYIFSDKTGTLTENHMIFRRCTIGGVDYNHHHPSIVEAHEDNKNKQKSKSDTVFILNSSLQDALIKMEAQLRAAHKVITPSTTIKHKKLAPQFSLSPDSQRIQDFFLLMALCNTVVVSRQPHQDFLNSSGLVITPQNSSSNNNYNGDELPRENDGDHSSLHSSPSTSNKSSIQTPSSSNFRPTSLNLPFIPDRISSPSPMDIRPIFEAESPDELALVDCAFRYNCRLLKRTLEIAILALPGEGIVEYKILHVLPFDSFRKRMSVILECPLTNEKVLYCKGADSTILTQLAPVIDSEMKELVMKTQHHLNTYCKKGLRILCMAKKIISDDEYDDWLKNHLEAELAFENRDQLLMQSAEEMETELELIGATGIEDRLQEGVPECINALRSAGIVIWVLTGDKQETAVNIAYSCKLFSYDMEVITVNARSMDATESTIKFYLDQISKDLEIPVQRSSSGQWYPRFLSRFMTKEKTPRSPRHFTYSSTRRRKRALVVDGRTLSYALDKSLERLFLKLAIHCGAVLCCRVTPLQKASLVKLVKDNLNVKTLAIGDGANDVSMIQTAAVGIGISGQEGMQAVMASDFAMPRFDFLERLLLVHGHWCYTRLARMVLYFFYKNAGFIFVLFWYQLYCAFSGMVAIDQLYLMFYNLIFTSFPPLITGIYDQDARDDMLLSNPRLYRVGRDSQVYKKHSFLINIIDALYQSVIIFFVAFLTYNDSNTGIWEFGTTLTTSCVLVQLLHLAIETRSWTWIHVGGMIISVLLYFGFASLYNAICNHCYSLPYGSPFWVMETIILTANFWFCILLTVVLAVLPRLVVKIAGTTLAPCDISQAVLFSRMQETSSKDFYSGTWSRHSSDSSVFFRPEGSNVATIEPSKPKSHKRSDEHTRVNESGTIPMKEFPVV